MKRFFFTIMAVLISVEASVLMQGCTIRFVTNSQVAPVPYPNAWHIELRVRAQLNRISAGLQESQLTQDSADVLASNDALIRHFVREYQGPPAEMGDLNLQQTYQLNNMLSDNDGFIDNAFQNSQAWNSFFQNGNFDYRSCDHTLFINYLDYRLNQQEADVKATLASGRLTPIQARDFRNRIQSIRVLKQNDYRANGRFELTEDQVNQLSQMTEDNGGYLRYRKNGSQGRWNKDRFNNWKTRAPASLSQGGNVQWGRRTSDNGSRPAPDLLQPSSNGVSSPDSFGQNTNNTHKLVPLDGVKSPQPSGLGQTAQPPPSSAAKALLPDLGQPAQPPQPTAAPLSSKGSMPDSRSVIVAPVLNNTPVLKFQVPTGDPSNSQLNFRRLGLTPTPKPLPPTAMPTKVPVKVIPVSTVVPKNGHQKGPGDSRNQNEKDSENMNSEGNKGHGDDNQGPGGKKRQGADSPDGDNSGLNSTDDKGNDHGKKPGGGSGLILGF